MIDPITGGVLALQAGAGIYQMYKGNKLAKEAEAMRQDYKTPQVIEDSLTNAKIRALEGMPAAMKIKYLEEIQNSSQSGINALKDRKAGISGVESINRNEQKSLMDLASQDANIKLGAEANLQGVQQNVAGYKDREYDLNVLQPYMAKLGAAEAMKGAGLQNVGTVLGSAAEMSQNRRLLNDIYGQNKQPVGQPTVTVDNAASNQMLNQQTVFPAKAPVGAPFVQEFQKIPYDFPAFTSIPHSSQISTPPQGYYKKYNVMTGGFDLTPIGQ